MKKTITTFILILASFVVYGQSIVKSDDFKVTEVVKDSAGKVYSFKTDFDYEVVNWKTNSKGIITEMECVPDMNGYSPTIAQMLYEHLIGRLEYTLGLDNIAPNNQATAKYKSKDYTYIVSVRNSHTLKIILNN